MSLIASIVDLANDDNYRDGQIVDMHAIEGGALKIRVPTGWRETDVKVVSAVALRDMFMIMDKGWEAEMDRRGTISRTIELDSCRLRCNAFRERGGLRHGLVMRKVPYEPIPLDQVGLPVHLMRAVANMRGLILISGQTGAGKTTTIASLLDHINATYRNHIITIEDPIEYEMVSRQSVITQREVPTDIRTFAEGIQDAMRQSPDVIFVSEIRDADTAETVLRASESGHLVLATLHASNAMGAIQKLLSFFPSDEWEGRLGTIANNLLMGIYQTLVPSLDGQKFVLASEILANHNQQIATALLARERWGQINEHAARSKDKVSRPLNASIMELLVAKKISASAALQATNNRIELRERMQQAGISLIEGREPALAAGR